MKTPGQIGRSVLEQLGKQRERLAQERAVPVVGRGPALEALVTEGVSRKSPTRRRPGDEKLIRPDRLALLVENDSFAPCDVLPWRGPLEHARPLLERALRAVGRIEDGETGEHYGTGWLVLPNLVVTNRHVALEFATRKSDGTGAFRTLPGSARRRRIRIDFKEEAGGDAIVEFSVVRIPFIAADDEQSPDLALFELAPQGTAQEEQPPPLPLFDGTPEPDQLVVALGYPAEDAAEADRSLMRELFDGKYSVKRLSPGTVMRVSGTVFEHDCATLGGSSGSPLVDVLTGGVLGVHFSGKSRVANWAVSAEALRAVLAQVTSAALPSRVSPELRPLAELEEGRRGPTRAAEEFSDRNGYQADFLKQKILLPMPVVSRRGELAMRLDRPDDSELTYRNFSVRQNADRRLPWVTAVNVDGKKLFRIPRSGSWARDGRLLAEHQAGDEIYKGSGFSRGHMVRRLDPCWGDERELAAQANLDTFVFTNACPQEQTAFNDALWGNLEDLILELADDEDLRITILTGPIFRDDDPYVGELKSPMSFYKIVAWRRKGQLAAVGFVLSQAAFVEVTESFAGTDAYGVYEVPLATIARRAGLVFDAGLQSADLNGGADESASRPRRVRSREDLERHRVNSSNGTP